MVPREWLYWDVKKKNKKITARKEALQWQIQTSSCYLEYKLLPATEMNPKHDLEEPLVVIK